MRFRIASTIAGLSLFAAAAASAQQPVTVTLTAPYAPGGSAVTAFGYYMSPYSGTVDGTQQRLNCVDFFHDVMIGDTWTAIQTNLGAAIADNSLLLNTRDGAVTNTLFTLSTALETYEKVAWLTSQYPTNPGSDPVLSTAIQTAIWSISSNSPGDVYMTDPLSKNDYVGTFTPNNSDLNTTGYWINQANTQFDQQIAGFYDNFYILTDRAGNLQEFVYSTPEPGTFVLFGTGLLLVVGFVSRGRRNAVGAEAA
jgi:PEP-CTERM motif